MKIRWENKYSKETGFVKKLNHKDGYFESTFSEEEAMEISDRQDIADKTVALLNEWCGQNTYTLIPTEKKPEPEVKEDETTEFIIEVETAEDKEKAEEKPAPVSKKEKRRLTSAEKRVKAMKARTV